MTTKSTEVVIQLQASPSRAYEGYTVFVRSGAKPPIGSIIRRAFDARLTHEVAFAGQHGHNEHWFTFNYHGGR